MAQEHFKPNVLDPSKYVDGTITFSQSFFSRFLLGRRQPGLHKAVAKVDLIQVHLRIQVIMQVNQVSQVNIQANIDVNIDVNICKKKTITSHALVGFWLLQFGVHQSASTADPTNCLFGVAAST